ncbi:MgtC/SapB family protein [Tolypothrix sp. PCC 7910]|uniref:MgtC/SapB family protein n=1 Tax=Tolypothrix sp. PCC 7910 TaxID=2099387 RepID=UPI0014278503|nr:MgtC/SapB family protein [Tolypothrix sp. PCC 7910]QIR40791.1 MgtC/SapB family protein [Tolypothrix sp. PCC 7910]
MGSMFISANDWPHIAFRLAMALLVGCMIGFNRQQGGRPAGMRTFMLVSMGAALFVMIPLQAEGDSPYAATNALSRTIQGVATGVGFLGAGLILQESPRKSNVPKVRGLTTAACVWTSAGLGAAIGCGLWQMGLLGGLLTLITLSGVKKLNRSFVSLGSQNKKSKSQELITTEENDDDD